MTARSARIAAAVVVPPLSCAVVTWAAGGRSFAFRPAGIVFLVIWYFWWLGTAWFRPLGGTSKYSRRATGMALALVPAYAALLVLVPWEYSHWAGPIRRDGALAWAGMALFAAGALLSTWSMRSLHGSFTMRLNVAAGQALVTTGPYAIVRNPGYLGYITALLGVGLALSSLVGLALALAAVIGFLVRIRREEQMLLAEFGEQYRAYMRRTRRLFPFVY